MMQIDDYIKLKNYIIENLTVEKIEKLNKEEFKVFVYGFFKVIDSYRNEGLIKKRLELLIGEIYYNQADAFENEEKFETRFAPIIGDLVGFGLSPFFWDLPLEEYMQIKWEKLYYYDFNGLDNFCENSFFKEIQIDEYIKLKNYIIENLTAEKIEKLNKEEFKVFVYDFFKVIDFYRNKGLEKEDLELLIGEIYYNQADTFENEEKFENRFVPITEDLINFCPSPFFWDLPLEEYMQKKWEGLYFKIISKADEG